MWKHTGPAQESRSVIAASSSYMFGRTASNLRAACGVEEGIAIRNAQKRKTKTLHLTAATASWQKERDHTQLTTVAASWPRMKYFVEKSRQLQPETRQDEPSPPDS
jgi:hypothetical protein